MSTPVIDQRFTVGIDLGTTNCAVAYVDLQATGSGARRIRIFQIPQLVGPGEVGKLPLLPSFLYLPGAHDLAPGAVVDIWQRGEVNFAGAFARDQGAKVPARLVSSAKSWLCHGKVDRHARILPWGADDAVTKVSPVAATAAYLNHIRMAWNAAWGDDESLHLEQQLIVVTVPASFDEVARELTLAAAKMAGLGRIVLLEEPLAAFYSWLSHNEESWRERVAPGELILVCDVGGGTTDFTLITLREAQGSPRFERIAVGDHLILGGDNMDLALARRLEAGFPSHHRNLGSDRWKSLCHQCRQAKERLLGGREQSQRITLVGEGSRLIANTVSAELKYAMVEAAILTGFFPLVPAHDQPMVGQRAGITEFGLPYEPEPAITRHLGWFLDQHRSEVAAYLGRSAGLPDQVLFNGGSLKPPVIQERICQAMRHWYDQRESRRPKILVNPDLDLAVAHGAAYYGLVKIGEGVRVGSGSARAFYLGITRPGDEAPAKAVREAICLVERGLEEGSAITLAERDFQVRTNQPVSFDLYSSSFRSGDRCGDIITVDDTLTRLPPLQTVVQFGKKAAQTTLPVHVEATYTEVGTLALWCRARTRPHAWQLQFQLRAPEAVQGVADETVFESARVAGARDRLQHAFRQQGDPRALQRLVKDLAQAVACPRDDWPLSFIRTLADDLLEMVAEGRKSALYESRWMNLLGFCLRPGTGEGFDDQRLRSLWKLYKHGPLHHGHAQVRAEWWILWRRVAAGLTAGQQRQVMQDVMPILQDRRGGAKRLSRQERLEIWMAVANMEKLQAGDKFKLGGQLLGEMSSRKIQPQQMWSLGRLGARELLYGPADRVIPPKQVAPWIEELLAFEGVSPKAVGLTLAQLARRTGDRSRDLSGPLRERVLAWMKDHDVASHHRQCVEQVVPMAQQDQRDLFGESLPAGLVLRE
jgi:molecular chaperone DnaK (HSP70)